MEGNNQSKWSVTLSLLIVIIGLFLVCAQQRATVASGGGEAADDDQFKQEILQLLNLTEDSGNGQKPASTDSVQQTATTSEPAPTAVTQETDTTTALANQDDLISLMMDDNTRTAEKPEAQKQPDKLGLSPQMFKEVKGDVARLESSLQRKNAQADSMRRVIAEQDARLRDLETRARPGKPAVAETRKRRDYGGEAVPAGFRDSYQAARDVFEHRRYQQAIQAFQKLLTDYPNSKMADNCQYWIGECYFGLRQFPQAIIEFQKVFAYSETDKHDDAQLMIGLSYLRSGQRDKAQKAFEDFLNNYGTSEYASIVKRYYHNI